MKEFVKKLIGRLEELSGKAEQEMNYYRELPEKDASCEVFADSHEKEYEAYCKAMDIVNQLAEEYNGGWIPVSERLPELTEGTECFKQSKCCLVTLKWWDGDMTESVGWYNQSGVWSDDSNNCKVLAWQPLPEPYRPKGE